MLLAQNYLHPNSSQFQQPQQQQYPHPQSPSHLPHQSQIPRHTASSLQPRAFYTPFLDADATIDIDLDVESPNSSPAAPHNDLLSAFDGIDSIAIARGSLDGSDAALQPALSQSSTFDDSSLAADMMPDSWLHGNSFPQKTTSRMGHYRESSLSSLGSAGPASPYSQNTSNPQIAVTDSMGDGYHGLAGHDDSYYQLTKSLNHGGHDALYGGYSSYVPETASASTYASLMASQKPRSDRGLVPPPPDFPVGSNRSQPVSVASSIAGGDSPATPSLPEPMEDERKRKTAPTGFSVPKLDRTMTDVYGDELYHPNFTITSAPASQPTLVSVSPTNEMFVQRLQAANSQHLTASHASGDRSPFRQGSPLAPTPRHDFPQAPAQMRFASAQQMREQAKSQSDAQVLRQQVSHATDTSTPQTISPKDAMLEFSEHDTEANFPLFPQHDAATAYGASQLSKMASQPSQGFEGLSLDTTFGSYMQPQLPAGVHVPQQYPFIAAPPRHQSSAGSASNSIMSASSRIGSTESATSEGQAAVQQKPTGTAADGGTYTCTYHGCTLRFETPALLQKHKREGHRQVHGLSGIRKLGETQAPTGMTSSLFNSQAGPHRCDRINPSTGKPCSTIFSRPYDLTRHEDTIHNARKQKVRCPLCTEEKTFSRADALTRHYRVCHPDVEFPGKHKRRGGAGAGSSV